MKNMLKTTALLGGVALFASACTSPDRFTDGTAGENSKTGAIVGAIAGAIAGRSVSGDGDKTKGTIIGAAIGAGAGTLIGQRLDEQEAALRQDLGNTQARIVNTGSELIVTMPQDILFSIDSAQVRSDLRQDLGAVASNLMAYPDTTVQVIGHTDNTGSAAYNLDLSQRRANAVANVLTANGVPPSRVRAIGAGEDRPVADNLTDAGRAQNRRVEIILTPNI